MNFVISLLAYRVNVITIGKNFGFYSIIDIKWNSNEFKDTQIYRISLLY